MNNSFLVYCESVVNRLNEMAPDKEIPFNLNELLYGDPFERLGTPEAEDLRNKFYKKVQTFAKEIPTFANAKKQLSSYKTQLDFVNKRIKDFEKQIEITGEVKADQVKLEQNDLYDERVYSQRVNEGLQDLLEAKQDYVQTIESIGSNYKESKETLDTVSKEYEELTANYEEKKARYIAMNYAKNTTKKKLEQAVELKNTVAKLEEIYANSKDKEVKALLDSKKELMKQMCGGELKAFDYYVKASAEYDDLKKGNLEIAKKEFELAELYLIDKKKEYNRAKRAASKNEKLAQMDLSNFASYESLSSFKDQLEKSIIDTSAIKKVDKNNVNMIAQALARKDLKDMVANNELDQARRFVTLTQINFNIADEIERIRRQKEAEELAKKVDDEANKQTSQDQKDDSTNVVPPVPPVPDDTDKKDDQKDDSTNVVPPVPPVPDTTTVDPDDKNNADEKNNVRDMKYINRMECVRIENASPKLLESLFEKKGLIAKWFKDRQIKKSGYVFTDKSDKAEYERAVEYAKEKYYERKINENVGANVKIANDELKRLETTEEEEVLRLYSKIKDFSQDSIDILRDTYQGDLRMYTALTNMYTIDAKLDEITGDKWKEFQEGHPDAVVTPRAQDNKIIEEICNGDQSKYQAVKRLLDMRNVLDYTLSSSELPGLSNPEHAADLARECSIWLSSKEVASYDKVSKEKFDEQVDKMLGVDADRLATIGITDLVLDPMPQRVSKDLFDKAANLKEQVDELHQTVARQIDDRLGENYELNDVPDKSSGKSK